MPMTTAAMLASSNRRKGWVDSSDDDESRRSSGFNPRDSAAVWNKGLGPSQSSIPSRKSSLASEERPPPGTPALPQFTSKPTSWSPTQSSAEAGPSRLPLGTSSPVTPASPVGSTFVGKRHSKTPSEKIIGPSAYSDHQRIMAASSKARDVPPKSPRRTGLAGAHHRQQSSSSSSGQSCDSAGRSSASSPRTNAFPGNATATPSASVTDAALQPVSSIVQTDANEQIGAASLQDGQQRSKQPSEGLPSSKVYSKTNAAISASVRPTDLIADRSTTQNHAGPGPQAHTKSKEKARPIAKNGLKKRGDLRIELPPSRGYKSAYPAILVDSSHLDEDYRSQTFRDSEDDDSSWPSTPSTTPLEAYLAANDVETPLIGGSKGCMSDGVAVKAAYLASSPGSSPALAPEGKNGVQGLPPRASQPSAGPEMCIAPSTPSTPTTNRISADLPPHRSPHSQEMDHARSASQAGPDRPAAALMFDIPQRPTRTPPRSSPGLLARAATKLASPKPHRMKSAPTVDTKGSSDAVVIARPGLGKGGERSRSLEEQSSPKKRQSFELRPILLNSTANHSRASTVAPNNGTGATNNFIHSGTNVGGLRYSKRWSNQSHVSSTTSLAMLGRISDVSDDVHSPSPRPSTTITVPSPRIGSEDKRLELVEQEGRPGPSTEGGLSDPYTPLPATRRAALVASNMPQPRTSVEEEVEVQMQMQKALLQEHIRKQRAKALQDNAFVAEWIQVSSKDLPDVDSDRQRYGNGGRGDFSNEAVGHKAGNGGGRPWKFGRFSASNMALPQHQNRPTAPISAQGKRTNLRRPKFEVDIPASGTPKAAEVASGPSPSGPNSAAGPRTLLYNIGRTLANKNAALQELCETKSIGALSAAALTVAGLGRFTLPYPVPDLSRPQVATRKVKTSKAARIKPAKSDDSSSPHRMHQDPGPKELPARPDQRRASFGDTYKARSHAEDLMKLKIRSDIHVDQLDPGRVEMRPPYELKDQGATVSSIHPEVGQWSLDDLDDDLGCDTDGDSDESGLGLATDDEEPVRMDLLDAAETRKTDTFQPKMLNVFFSSIRGAPETEAVITVPREGEANPGLASSPGAPKRLESEACMPQLTRKFSLRSGALTSRDKEIRLCVQVPTGSSDAVGDGKEHHKAPVHWKAVKVANLASSTCEDLGYLEKRNALRRRTRAMSIEAEVQRGQFANFVGMSSPKRKGRGASLDSTKGGPEHQEQETGQQRDSEDLFISKEGKASFIVRRPDLPRNNREEILEVIARSAPSADSTTIDSVRGELPMQYSVDEQNQADRSKLPGTPMFDLDRSFPSPFSVRPGRMASEDSARDSEHEAGVLLMHVRRKGFSGLRASFEAYDGRKWFWRTTSPLLAGSPTSASGSATGIAGGAGLSGADLYLFAMDGLEPVQLATYSANSLPKSSLGLFTKSRGKAAVQVKPDPAEVIPPAIAPLPRTVQLGPAVGIRGAKPIRSNSNALHNPGGPAMRQRMLMQNRKAAMSTDSLMRPDPDQASSLAAAAAAAVAARRSMDSARPAVPYASHQAISTAEPSNMGPQRRMGEVNFLADCYDHDLATVTLLALFGMIKV